MVVINGSSRAVEIPDTEVRERRGWNVQCSLFVCLFPGVWHRVHGLRLARLSAWHALVSIRRRSQLHRYYYLDLHLLPVRQGGAQTAHQLDTDGNTQCLTRSLSPCTTRRPIPIPSKLHTSVLPVQCLPTTPCPRAHRPTRQDDSRLHPALKLMSGAKPPLPPTQRPMYL